MIRMLFVLVNLSTVSTAFNMYLQCRLIGTVVLWTSSLPKRSRGSSSSSLIPRTSSLTSLISWRVLFDQQTPITRNREIRGWSKLDADGFRAALVRSELCDVTQHPVSADDFFELYHCVLQRLADQFSPIKKITIRRQRLAVWMDAECRQLRRM